MEKQKPGFKIWLAKSRKRMSLVSRAMAAAFTLTLVSACSTYTGDNLLRLPAQSSTHDQDRIISKAKDGVSDILDSLGVSEEKKGSLQKISPKNVIRDSGSLELTHIDNLLVVGGADANIAFAKNSIIISMGALHISHSSNNIVVCGGDVVISHDGSSGSGSLVISKGKTKITHAGDTLIYAVNGVEISHARSAKAFNTGKRKTSWGHINNIIVEPLFREETAPNRPLLPTGPAG
jgi:hypothetical protein